MNREPKTSEKSCGNVFIDIGFPQPEAIVMHMRIEVLARIIGRIKEQGWTHADVAHNLDISQRDARRLLEKNVDPFTLDMLLIFAIRSGLSARLEWNSPRK